MNKPIIGIVSKIVVDTEGRNAFFQIPIYVKR